MELSEDQREAVRAWLRREEGVAVAPADVRATGAPLAHYVREWGPADRTAPLGAAAARVYVWRGAGYALWVADFGDVRAVVAF